MVTKEKARKILKAEGENFSDDEIEKILFELQRQAKIVIKEFNTNSVNTKVKDGDEKNI
jgi:Ca2+-binding EF-hand superfamily protein